MDRRDRLATSVEVLQELLHHYMSARRPAAMEDAFALVAGCVDEVWSVDHEDIELALDLAGSNPGLDARDLLHLASCIRRKPDRLVTRERGPEVAWARRPGFP